jgi:hypothetical protein
MIMKSVFMFKSVRGRSGNPGVLEGAEPPRLKERGNQPLPLVAFECGYWWVTRFGG